MDITLPEEKHVNKDYSKSIKKNEDESKINFIVNNFEKLSTNINEIGFSLRTQNCLNNLSIKDIGELIQLSGNYLLKTPNFGRKSLSEIQSLLKNINLNLDTVFDWPPENYKSLKKNKTANSIININPTSREVEIIKVDDQIVDRDFLFNLIKSSLTDREYSIIKDRFWKGETLEKIGQDKKVTRERIRQIESKAVRKLKKNKSIVKKFLEKHKNEIFNKYSCTPELVTEKSISKIKIKYPLNDLEGLIYLSIEIIHEGNYGESHVQKKYSFFKKNFNSLGGAWYKKGNINDLENNTEDLIYLLDKKPLPRQCENARLLLKLTKEDYMNSFHMAQNNTNYYMIRNYICKNSYNFSNLSNAYLVRMHEVLFNSSPNTFLKNDDIIKLIKTDSFLKNCPYSKTILRVKDLIRGKGYIKTDHLFYITGSGIIPIGVEKNDGYADNLIKLETADESINVEENEIKSVKLEKYLNIIEEILINHKALSISALSEIYVKKIDQIIKPNQALRILGILLSSYSKFSQIGPGVWSLKNTPNPVGNLINFIVEHKNHYPVDMYAFLKLAGEDLSRFKGFNGKFEEQICIKGKNILKEKTYQSLLNISEPSKWDVDEKIIDKFQNLKKISNFYLDIAQSGTLNLNNEKKIKSYDINNLGRSILYIFKKETISVIGLNHFFDYSLFWNTSIFNLALLSFANLVEVPKKNLHPHRINNTNIIELQKLVLNELIEFGSLSWNREFGKKIISLIILNYADFIKKDNWITENLLLHGKI
ncbi:hypothetical protein N8910_01465 [Candidatus Pelagibacter ubique]|nr:hypothetical protein [Candidatus Pelagibacter ubique]